MKIINLYYCDKYLGRFNTDFWIFNEKSLCEVLGDRRAITAFELFSSLKFNDLDELMRDVDVEKIKVEKGTLITTFFIKDKILSEECFINSLSNFNKGLKRSPIEIEHYGYIYYTSMDNSNVTKEMRNTLVPFADSIEDKIYDILGAIYKALLVNKTPSLLGDRTKSGIFLFFMYYRYYIATKEDNEWYLHIRE